MFWPLLSLELPIYVLLDFFMIEFHHPVDVVKVVDRRFALNETSLVRVYKMLVLDLRFQLLE